MKHIASTCLLLASMALTAPAIERPSAGPDSITATRSSQQAQNQAAAENHALPNPVWLGVIPSPVPEPLIAQLELSGNPGLLVRSISPGSPAEKAGLKEYDILLRAGDSSLREPNDLSKSIEQKKEGDSLNLEIIRGGKKQELTATLEKNPGNISHIDGTGETLTRPEKDMKPNRHGGIQDLFPRSRRQMNDLRRSLSDFQNDWTADFEELDRQLNEWLNPSSRTSDNKTRQRILDMLRSVDRGHGGTIRNSSSFSYNIQDDSGAILLNSQDGNTTLKALDPSGNVIFEGPYNTDEQKAAVPDNIRQKVDKISFVSP